MLVQGLSSSAKKEGLAVDVSSGLISLKKKKAQSEKWELLEKNYKNKIEYKAQQSEGT